MNLKSMDAFGPHGCGVFYELSDEVYHSVQAVSSTSLKQTYKSLKHFKAYMEGMGKKDTAALRIGRLAHMAILEPERFKETVFYSLGDHKGQNPYKTDVKANPGKTVLTIQEVELLTGLLTGLNDQPFIMEVLKGGQKEVTVFVMDPITGLALKARLDFVKLLNVGAYLTDYKTCECAEPEKFERDAFYYKYYLQIAFYTYVAQLAGFNIVATAFVAQEKEYPYAAASAFYPQDVIEEIIEVVIKPRLKMISEAVDADKWPGYPPMATPISLLRTEGI